MRHSLKRKGQRLVAWPPVGTLSFGSLDRLTPVSRNWGFDRGSPVDRFYIEKFLGANADRIAGRVLEIGDAFYTPKFGQDRIVTSDVLHLQPNIPGVTIVADLTNAPELESDRFDCIICTQTLNFIYDFRAALSTLHRLVKPGGFVLLTVAGICQTSDHDVENWGDFWRFTSWSLTRVCREAGHWREMDIQTWGNVLSSSAFLYGVAAEELDTEDLAVVDPHYQLVISACLQK
jgi:SAM-dependent methyltransferase